MDLVFKRGFAMAHDPNAYMERSEKRGNYRPQRRKKPPFWYALLTIIMLAVLRDGQGVVANTCRTRVDLAEHGRAAERQRATELCRDYFSVAF